MKVKNYLLRLYVTKSHPVIHHFKVINKQQLKYNIFMSLFWKDHIVMVIVTVLTPLKQKKLFLAICKVYYG